MKWIDLLLLSVQNLWRRKLRTILTMVGVMIGTASIVVMVSLGIGINQGYIDSLSSTGELTTIELNSQTYYGGGGMVAVSIGGSSSGETSKVKAQKLDDTMIKKIENLEHVTAVSPMMDIYNLSLFCGKLRSYNSLVGINPDAAQAMGIDITEGNYFSKSSGDTVEILLGEGTKSSFRNPRSRRWDSEVPDVDWLNAKYRLILYDYSNTDDEGNPKEKEFKARVVGIIPDDGKRYSYNMYTSIDSLKRIINKNKKAFRDANVKTDEYSNAIVKVDDFSNVLAVQEQIKSLGVNAWSSAEMIKSMQESSRSMQLMLGGVGSVAMLVAAISIANTMLMSIYERTREIGVMKVLGCRMSNIGSMFLSEAGIIGFLGGVVGLGLSYGIGAVINTVLAQSGAGMGYQSVIPFWLAGSALLFSVLVGLLAGLYPSQRAMRLSALAAIRNE